MGAFHHWKVPPLLLAQVCQQWRSVTLSTRNLWTSIFFEFKLDDAYYSRISLDESDVSDSDLWFGRAANRPLSIIINCTEVEAEVPDYVLTVLCKYFPRCWRLKFHIPARHIFPINDIPGPFPFLRQLFTGHFIPFSNAPNLRHLCFPSSSPWLSPLIIGAESVRLTYLEIGSIITHAECLNILRVFPQLLHLSVARFRPDQPSIQHSSPLPILPLQSLRLEPINLLLASITLPRLHRLTLDIVDAAAADHFLRFLSASSPEITYLDITFYRNYTEGNPLRLCTAAGHRVSTLKIRIRESLAATVPTDYELLHQDHLFPTLDTPHVHQYSPLGWLYEPLLAMLECRLGSKLSAFKLTLGNPNTNSFDSAPDSAILERFRELSSRGPRVHIEIPTMRFSYPDPDTEVGPYTPFYFRFMRFWQCDRRWSGKSFPSFGFSRQKMIL
ncbi:hypothetical protein C8J57DRAFT_1672141 [Mycena rebaudengoi]|nr:hypothetical protein C8J57DRAFT_1672141 [Mycena rebaudengoi]